jgi:type II secretory pathway component PulM
MLRRLRKLTPGKLRVLASAGVVVVLVRLSLWLLPSRVLLRLVLRRVARAPTAAALTSEMKTIARAVRSASRRVPSASCLTQALATQVLLARAGHASELRIGVAREEGEEGEGLLAHAWVEVAGQVLIGGRGIHRYQRLPDIRPILDSAILKRM